MIEGGTLSPMHEHNFNFIEFSYDDEVQHLC